MNFILRWLVGALAIGIAAYIVPSVSVDGLVAAFIAALILGFANAVVKPILVILTLPITVVTFGLFLIVINTLMVLLTAAIVPGFAAEGFWVAFLFSVVLSVITFVLNGIFKDESAS